MTCACTEVSSCTEWGSESTVVEFFKLRRHQCVNIVDCRGDQMKNPVGGGL